MVATTKARKVATMTNSNKYESINNAFEKAVTKLQDNLQYLIDNNKVSNAFVTIQNLIIKSLIDYQQQTEHYISTLEMENFELFKKAERQQSQQQRKQQNMQECFEAICIIHGIMDFIGWINKGNKYLVNEAVYLYKENTIQLPIRLLERIEALPPNEKQAIENILFKAP